MFNLDNCLELKRYATFNGNLIAPSKSQKMYCSLGPEFLFILNNEGHIVEFIRFEAVESMEFKTPITPEALNAFKK